VSRFFKRPAIDAPIGGFDRFPGFIWRSQYALIDRIIPLIVKRIYGPLREHRDIIIIPQYIGVSQFAQDPLSLNSLKIPDSLSNQGSVVSLHAPDTEGKYWLLLPGDS